MRIDPDTYRLTEIPPIGTWAARIGMAGLVLSLIGWYLQPAQFAHSYLTAFIFWLSLGLGALFFTMLHHLVNATWSIVLRRVTETLMLSVIPLTALFLLVIFGIPALFEWSHPDVVATDALLQGKSGYLNIPFFLIRAVIYFLVWIWLVRALYTTSIRQDTAPHPDLDKRMRTVSAPGMVLFAFTITFASFDWLMSLDAHWYSTIFGVYVYAGAFLGILSLITLVCILFRRRGLLTDTITIEHYHDLGRLLFGFTVFWAYIAFSQYLLIWYGNIPEETVWYLHRWEGAWKIISLVLVFGHFIVPFLVLMLRAAKRNIAVLAFLSVWLLIMHWIDVFWLVGPNLHPHGAHLSWLDLTTWCGIGGIVCWYCWRRFAAQAVVPVRDPRLQASIAVKNE